MRSLAECLDSLAAGKHPRVGDVLMQQFKALEMSVRDRGWSLVNGLEVTNRGDGLVSDEERYAAVKCALLQKKLNEARTKLDGERG